MPLSPRRTPTLRSRARSFSRLERGAADVHSRRRTTRDNSRAARFFSGALTFAQRPSENFGYAVTYHGLATRGAFRDGPPRPATASTSFFEPAGSTRNDFDGSAHTLNARTDFRLGRTTSSPPVTSSSARITSTARSHVDCLREQLFGRRRRAQPLLLHSGSVALPGRPPATVRRLPRAKLLARRAALHAVGERALRAVSISTRRPNAYTGDGSIAYFFRIDGHEAARARRQRLSQAVALRTLRHVSSAAFLAEPLHRRSATRASRPNAPSPSTPELDQTLRTRPRARCPPPTSTRACRRSSDFRRHVAQPTRSDASAATSTPAADSRAALELSARPRPRARSTSSTSYTYTNADQRRRASGRDSLLRAFPITSSHSSRRSASVGARCSISTSSASSNYLAPIFDPATFRSVVYRFDGIVKADRGANYTLPLSESRRCASSATSRISSTASTTRTAFARRARHGQSGRGVQFLNVCRAGKSAWMNRYEQDNEEKRQELNDEDEAMILAFSFNICADL